MFKETAEECSNYAAGTDFCDQGTFPTCKPSHAERSQVQAGMTYKEVVNIVGCHGVLSARNGTVVIYTWGTAGFVEFSVSMNEGKVLSIS